MAILTVYGEPQGKGRPRFTTIGGHARSYTPAKTKAYEQLVASCFEGQMLEGYLNVTINAYFSIPKSFSQAKRQLIKTSKLFPDKKPDIDNIAKTILDGLNGVAYEDDKQIIKLSVQKFYDDNPRVEIEIREVIEMSKNCTINRRYDNG